MYLITDPSNRHVPANKGRLTGQKAPVKLKEIWAEIWAIGIRLQLSRRVRDVALFNLGIDSKLRGCDLVNLRVHDIAPSELWSCSVRLIGQSSSRSRSRPGNRSRTGSRKRS